jgi:hypothetical protein
MSKPLLAIHHATEMVLVPGEVAPLGNVTGGRKLARQSFMRWATFEQSQGILLTQASRPFLGRTPRVALRAWRSFLFLGVDTLAPSGPPDACIVATGFIGSRRGRQGRQCQSDGVAAMMLPIVVARLGSGNGVCGGKSRVLMT